MNRAALEAILELAQVDAGNRGLRAVPGDNLITHTSEDYSLACERVADAKNPRIAIVTGFTIPSVAPPMGETDGPLGALFLARAWAGLGMEISLMSDGTTLAALSAGVDAAGLWPRVNVSDLAQDCPAPDCDFLIAIERVGPNHNGESVGASRDEFERLVPIARRNRCYSMRGHDMTELTRPAHLMFEARDRRYATIGIGDGGNEIGMGRVPWHVVRSNIVNGELVACRTAADYLIVAGISNWGAYALGAGVRILQGAKHDDSLYDPKRERELLQTMINAGPLVDGVTLRHETTVDGLPFDQYCETMSAIGRIERAATKT